MTNGTFMFYTYAINCKMSIQSIKVQALYMTMPCNVVVRTLVNTKYLAFWRYLVLISY